MFLQKVKYFFTQYWIYILVVPALTIGGWMLFKRIKNGRKSHLKK